MFWIINYCIIYKTIKCTLPENICWYLEVPAVIPQIKYFHLIYNIIAERINLLASLYNKYGFSSNSICPNYSITTLHVSTGYWQHTYFHPTNQLHLFLSYFTCSNFFSNLKQIHNLFPFQHFLRYWKTYVIRSYSISFILTILSHF